jgi:hypothetical protein
MPLDLEQIGAIDAAGRHFEENLTGAGLRHGDLRRHEADTGFAAFGADGGHRLGKRHGLLFSCSCPALCQDWFKETK